MNKFYVWVTCFLLLCSVLTLNAVNLFSQDVKLTFNLRSATIKEVCNEIEEMSDYVFIFSVEALKVCDSKVNISANSRSIKEVLDEVLSPNGLNYRIMENQIVVYDVDADKKANIVNLESNNRTQQQPKMITIKGIVVDEQNEPLPGVSIYTKSDRTTGVSSDISGGFILEVPDKEDVLVFSFIGMVNQEIAIGSDMDVVLNIVMKADDFQLGEVVVTGIFERKAESYTGAATVVKKDELMRSGSQNVLQNLKNIDPGFRLVDNIDFGSNPNRMPEIQMRGQQGFPDIEGTFSGNPNQPLFILDGFEADITTVFDIDMNRIESIVLLKDAAAKAIYGSRAANGVVVIETRKPEPGRLKVNYKGDLNLSIPDLTGYNLTNSFEKYTVEKETPSVQDRWFMEKYLNSILSDVVRGIDTYWLSQPVRIGVGQRHSVYLEGGDEFVRYSMNVLMNDNKGVMKGSDRKTLGGGFMLSYRHKNFLFRNQFNVTVNNSNDSPYGSFSEYVALNPYWAPYNEDGSIKQILGYVGGGGLMQYEVGNPLWNAKVGTKNFSRYNELINNFYVEWQALEDLKFVGRLGVTKQENSREDFYPASHSRFVGYLEDRFFERGSYSKSNGDILNIRGDINASYSLLFDKSIIYANVGANIQQNSSESVGFTVIGFPNDKIDFIAAGREFPVNSRPSGYERLDREIGLLSAINYSYDNRYLADFSYRANASSMFGKDNKWGHFWSTGIGWNLHNESVFRNSEWLKQFKLRASTGFTGSQNFNPFQALATFSYYQSQAYDNWLGSYLLGLPNDDLKWQKTQDYNIGFDMNLFNKLNVRYDYYVQNTKDQLLDLTIPQSMGFSSYKENLGSMENKGMEMKMNYQILHDVRNDNYLNAHFSFSTNENRIKKISNALKGYNDEVDNKLTGGTWQESTRPKLRFVEGQSVNAIWAVRSLGIDPASGNEIFLNKDGDVTTEWSASDLAVVGNSSPKLNGSFGFHAKYNGFILSTYFNYLYGGQIYNQTLVDRVENADVKMNVDRRIFDAVWRNIDDDVAFSFNRSKTTRPTSRFVQDLNELRLSSINFGYKFPKSSLQNKLGVENLQINFFMDDVFRLSTVKVERGLEYPYARTYSFSLQFNI